MSRAPTASGELSQLLSEIAGGDRSASDRVVRFQTQYRSLTAAQRAELFDALLRRVEIRREQVERPLKELLDARTDDPILWTRRLSGLRRALESPRLRAFRRFAGTPTGLAFLLEMRADIVAAQRESRLDLQPLDEEIAHLFNSWFQGGFLYLEEITLDSSFQQIRFLKEHELVHPMTRLDEMGSRLGKDRRLFALYHRALDDIPVVFIEVALTEGIASSIDAILDPPESGDDSARADTAIFYSINNTQNGLAGLGLGKALISRVVEVLRREHPEVTVFATLSPIPGLWDRYLRRILDGDDGGFALKREAVERLFPARARKELLQRTGAAEFAAALGQVLQTAGWMDDEGYRKALEKPLVDLAYFYLTREKNRRGGPLNPVAAFHLGNGARVSRRHVRFGANRSERGLRESCGVMVNYVYSMSWTEGISRSMRALLASGGTE